MSCLEQFLYTYIHTHTLISETNEQDAHAVCISCTFSEAREFGAEEQFQHNEAVPQLPGYSPSSQQCWEMRSPHRKKITTKQVYRTWLLPPLFANTFKHVLTEFCLSCILISKAACLGLLIAWGLERFPKAWGENCPPGIKEGWSL